MAESGQIPRIRNTWRHAATVAPDSHARGPWFNPRCAHSVLLVAGAAFIFARRVFYEIVLNGRMRAPVFVVIAFCIAGATLAGGCASSADDAGARAPTGAELASELPRAVTAAGLRRHLAALQRIADDAGGTRAAGSRGYAASVAYVRRTLAAAGYEPEITPFRSSPIGSARSARGSCPSPASDRIEAIDYSPPTPARGLRGRLAFTNDGCSPGDFDGARGRIAVARRGICFIAQKAQNAAGPVPWR